MTALFLEYQAQKELKDNAQSMIGKLYYWCTNLAGEEIPFNTMNLLKVTGIHDEVIFPGNIVVDYQYIDSRLIGDEPLDYFLKSVKLYDGDNL